MEQVKKCVLYVHGQGGSAAEAQDFVPYCIGCDVIGVDYDVYLPWVTVPLIRQAYEAVAQKYESVTLIAGSIGAYFSMLALGGCRLEKALFISPIVNMEKLISDMMGWAGVTEAELAEKGEIETDFGQTLSMEYLRYARAHAIVWGVPTEILYAGHDNLTARATVDEFARAHKAGLTVMDEGEHWFHTEAQLAFRNAWLKKVL